MSGFFYEQLISAQSAGSAITAAADTSAIPAAAKYTLPPNFLTHLGQKVIIKASGKISSVITTPGTARWRLKFGATTVFDGLAILLDSVAAHTNVGWLLQIELALNTVGASATLIGGGLWTCEDILGVPATAPKGSLSAVIPWNSAPASGTAFDATASQQVDLTFTQTEATGSMTLQTYELLATT